MNGAALIIFTLIWFTLCYIIYGKYLQKLFGIDAKRMTPAHTKKDGVDYIPTKWPILFGHHFASIAGAGPILGPVFAAYFGWLPVALWIILGCVFIGAMHDFAALFLSVRDEGRSIAHVIERQIGYYGRQTFLIFCWAALILIGAIFAICIAKTFIAVPAVATASILFICISPIFGFLVYKKNLSILNGSIIFVPLVFAAVWIGIRFPLSLEDILGIHSPRNIWIILLLVYGAIASVLPIWLLLQPRDYLNSYLLFAMLILGFAGIFVSAPHLNLPAFTGFKVLSPKDGYTNLFPILFITVACGACSGFHSLVSAGTSSKQVDTENNIFKIGYGAMLMEGILAIIALVSVAYLTKNNYYEVAKNPVPAFSQGIAHFCVKLGIPESGGKVFIAMTVSAFMLTTLDTVIRLTRFTWQELFIPPADMVSKTTHEKISSPLMKILSDKWFASILAVVLTAVMAFSGSAGKIWPVFGATNQLLAGLSLMATTIYIYRKKKNIVPVLLPMLFMMSVTLWGLVSLLISTYKKHQFILCGITSILLTMALSLIAIAALSLFRTGDNKQIKY